MKTFLNQKTGNMAEANSNGEFRHSITVKDDFGNHKEKVHYVGVTKEFVEKDLADDGFFAQTSGRF